MKWVVTGQMKKTGEPGKLTVEAETMREAFDDAKRRGLTPIDATKMSESPKPARPTTSATILTPQPRTTTVAPVAAAAAANQSSHPLERIMAFLFIVSGIGSMFVGIFERISASLIQTTGSNYELNSGAVARQAAISLHAEYFIVTGGVCLAIGVALLLLRQIAINTAPRGG